LTLTLTSPAAAIFQHHSTFFLRDTSLSEDTFRRWLKTYVFAHYRRLHNVLYKFSWLCSAGHVITLFLSAVTVMACNCCHNGRAFRHCNTESLGIISQFTCPRPNITAKLQITYLMPWLAGFSEQTSTNCVMRESTVYTTQKILCYYKHLSATCL